MFRVLIVEDEPFNVKGLMVLIDWNREGYEIVKTASNGKEALDYLKDHEVDLIIADIKMPVMNGLELLETLRKDKISDADFVILSGYGDFEYARRAIGYNCMDYILKPVQSEQLLQILQKSAQKRANATRQKASSARMKKAYLEQNIAALLQGRFTPDNLDYVKNNLKVSSGVRYVCISLDGIALIEEMSEDELEEQRNKIFQNCREFLKEDGDHCIQNIFGYQSAYEVGLIYCNDMAAKRGYETEQFMEELFSHAGKDMDMPITLLVGKQVGEIDKISRSYGSACMLRSLQNFREKREIYYYEEELQVKQAGSVLCKENLDQLVRAVEQNDRGGINKSVDRLFQELEHMSSDGVSLNINYLLFQLIHLAVERDETVNQEEVMRYIGENVLKAGFVQGSKPYLRKFAFEYVEYLTQLRKNVSRGVLKEVEKEVRIHYAENLTLKDLSNKYFINSSYLGQLFSKKYGQSFKDYLNNYRINEAAKRLLHTDKKISLIAEEVGYRDMDYFVRRFIAVKGCTPAKYRKQSIGERIS